MAKAPVNVEDLDFEGLSDQSLRELMRKVKETLSSRVANRIEEFRQLAGEAGFTVTLTKVGEEGSRRPRRRSEPATGGADRRRGVAAKYQNPDDPAQKWAGRGRKPKWVEDRLAKGASLDDLLIDQAAPQ